MIPWVRIYRGLAWSEKKDYDKAIADYNDALRLEPDNAFALYARASAWAKKQYARADGDLARASQLAPTIRSRTMPARGRGQRARTSGFATAARRSSRRPRLASSPTGPKPA